MRRKLISLSLIFNFVLWTTALKLHSIEFRNPSISSTASPTHPPVILIHGLLGNSRNFATIANELVLSLATPRKVFAFDLRNHGVSPHSPTMSYTELAGDVIETMDSIGLQNAVLIGHSLGGKVAMAASLLNPTRVAGLIVLDMAPKSYSSTSDVAQSLDAIIETCVSLPLDSCTSKREFSQQLSLSGVDDQNLRAFISTNVKKVGEKFVWSTNIKAIQEGLSEIHGFFPFVGEEYNRIYAGDCYFIAGENSNYVTVDDMKQIKTLYEHHMLTKVKGSGHWVHADAPDRVTSLIRQYLDRCLHLVSI